MYNIFEFVVKDTPRTGEDILGFIARLGALNGRYNLGRITSVFDVAKVAQQAYYPESVKHKALIEKLAKSIKQEPKNLSYAFTSSLDYFPHYRSASTKICTECCSNSKGYVKAHWQHHHISHCEIHKTPLISECPDCGKPIKVTGDLLSGCHHCGLRWQDISVIPAKEIPCHQAILESLSHVETEDYLKHLYNAYMFIKQQYNVTVSPYKPQTYIQEVTNKRFEQAFALIANKSYRQQWLEAKFEHLLNSSSISFFCRQQIIGLASRIIKRTPCYVSKLEDCSLKSGLQPNYLATDIEKPSIESYSVTRKDAASLIGLDLKSLNFLIDHKKIKLANLEAKDHINLSHLAEYLLKLVDGKQIKPKSEPNNSLISIENLKKCLKYFNADLTVLLELIDQYQIEMFYISPKKVASINKVYVDRNLIINLLEQELINRLHARISENRFKEITFLNDKQYLTLKNTLNLKVKNVGYKQDYCDQHCLSMFFNKYVIINRWAKINSISLLHAKEYLKHIPSLKVINNSRQDNLLIYEKSLELQKALYDLSEQYTGELPKLAFLYL